MRSIQKLRQARRITTLAVVLMLTVCGALLTGCGKTTNPKTEEYNIYFAGSWYQGRSGDEYIYSRHFYVYDLDSLSLRDSIPIPGQAAQVEVSPDGHWLYAWCVSWGSYQSSIVKMNAVTKQLVWSVPGTRITSFLNRGQFLIKGTRTGPELIDPADGHTIRKVTIPISLMKGPADGTQVAGVVLDTIASTWDTVVTVLDVETGEMHGNYVPRLESGQALQVIYAGRLHPDRTRVLVIGAFGISEYSWLMVGDVETGETLLRFRLYSPYGEIALSEDGKLAAVSDPGNAELGDIHHAIEFFDLVGMQHVKTLDHESGLPGNVFSQIRFLPGDRKIAVAPTAETITGGPFCIIDRATLTVESIVEPPVPFVGAIGVGVRPND